MPQCDRLPTTDCITQLMENMTLSGGANIDLHLYKEFPITVAGTCNVVKVM